MGERDDVKSAYDQFAETPNPGLKRGYLTRNILPHVPRMPGLNPHIVEIGPGNGELLGLLRGLGHTRLSAFEVCARYAEDLRAQGFSVQLGSSAVDYLKSFEDSAIDCLLLVDVLEHLPMTEVLSLLAEAKRVLAGGGCVIAQVPNVSGLFGWNTFAADPTHMTPFNERGLERCFHVAGFRQIESFELKLPGGPANAAITVFRKGIFAAVRFLMRAVGARPVRILTHNVITVARVSGGASGSFSASGRRS